MIGTINEDDTMILTIATNTKATSTGTFSSATSTLTFRTVIIVLKELDHFMNGTEPLTL